MTLKGEGLEVTSGILPTFKQVSLTLGKLDADFTP